MQHGCPLCLMLVFAAFLAGCDTTGEDPLEFPPPREVAEPDYTTMENGLKIYDFTVGEGAQAETGLAVSVHYAVWLSDSTLIDASYLSGIPITLILGNGDVIAGWEEGLVGMRVGGDRQLVVPPSLAYGTGGFPEAGIPPEATLIFEVALLDVGIVVSE